MPSIDSWKLAISDPIAFIQMISIFMLLGTAVIGVWKFSDYTRGFIDGRVEHKWKNLMSKSVLEIGILQNDFLKHKEDYLVHITSEADRATKMALMGLTVTNISDDVGEIKGVQKAMDDKLDSLILEVRSGNGNHRHTERGRER